MHIRVIRYVYVYVCAQILPLRRAFATSERFCKYTTCCANERGSRFCIQTNIPNEMSRRSMHAYVDGFFCEFHSYRRVSVRRSSSDWMCAHIWLFWRIHFSRIHICECSNARECGMVHVVKVGPNVWSLWCLRWWSVWMPDDDFIIFLRASGFEMQLIFLNIFCMHDWSRMWVCVQAPIFHGQNNPTRMSITYRMLQNQLFRIWAALCVQFSWAFYVRKKVQ